MTEPATQAAANLFAELNPEQRAAVDAPADKSVMVVAGAGTGKTRVLTARIARLISDGADPGKICCTAFTKRASVIMRARLEGLLGKSVGRAFIGTTHGWAYRMLRQFGPKIGVSADFAILLPAEQAQVLGDYCPSARGLNEKALRAVVNCISRLKCQRLQTEQLLADQDAVRAVWDEYHAFCRDNNYLDFDDIILRGADVAEYAPQYEHLFVDEFQDINHAQIILCEKLSARGKFFVVGDDDQKIYGFRGAESSFSGNAEIFARRAVVLTLRTNYRSAAPILEFANTVIDENCFRRPKSLVPARAGAAEQPVCLYLAKTGDKENAMVAASIHKTVRAMNINYSDVAVIARTQHVLLELEGSLAVAGVPYQIMNTPPVIRRKDCQAAFAFMRLVAEGENDDVLAWQKALAATTGVGEKTVKEIFVRAGAGRRLRDVCAEHRRARTLVNAVSYLRDVLAGKTGEVADGDRFLGVVTAAAENFVKAAPAAASARGADGAKIIAEMARRFAAMEAEAEAGELELLRSFASIGQLGDMSESESKNRVSLLTAHAAKGSEFEAVYVVRAEEGSFPHYLGVGEDIEEERRLFFVACTRARKFLALTAAMRRELQHGGGSAPARPSRFLSRAMREKLIARVLPGN